MDRVYTVLEHVIQAWTALHQQQPLVQCMTNSVAGNYVANVLLAAGASPAMIDNPFEAEGFTAISGALSINTGTPTAEQMQAMQISAKAAFIKNKPWVLDPVGYGAALPWRSRLVEDLLAFKPAVIRGNASEISALAGNQTGSKGVDSTVSSHDMYQQALPLLDKCECVAISGESDYILSQQWDTIIQINGGSYLQPKVTASGCALGALIAAYAAVTTPTIAAIAAHLLFAIAGKLAYQKAQSVGSFNVAFMDEIYRLNADTISLHADLNML